MAFNIDAKFEGNLAYAFKNDMKNLANFDRLKNSDFILESKMAELNHNKNSKQPDRPDAITKLTKLIINKTFYTCSTESFPRKQSS